MNNCGDSVDAENGEAVAAEMARVKPQIVSGELAAGFLQSRSPSCGVHEVYDGTFTGRLIPGQGLLAEAHERGGVRIVDVADV